MKFASRRWIVAGVVTSAVAGSLALLPNRALRAADADAPQPLSVGQLTNEAFAELRAGHFDKTNELLGTAASKSHDPQITQMAKWASGFESQREEFASERHKQYEKEATNVKLLEGKDKLDAAVDHAARAYLLDDNKKTFETESWVQSLVKDTIHRAEDYDKSEHWVKELRLYSDLSAIEPAQPLWKDRLKLATRRVRLLAMYTPDSFKASRSDDVKEQAEIDAILSPPTTQPTTAPAAALSDSTSKPSTLPSTQPAEPDADGFKVDWRDTLKGVRMDVLWDALVDARTNYYREVSFRDLGLGGLDGLQAVVTTHGLDKAFPNLADEAKRTAFLAAIQDRITAVKDAAPATEQLVLRDSLKKLEAANHDTIQLPDEVLINEFADGAFARLDPFSTLIWPTDVEEFHKTVSGEFSGVGIQIQSDDDGSLKVVSPLEDSPAYKAGIKAGDIITRIDGKSAKGISINQAVKSITGEKGTVVVLTVRNPEGKSRDFPITREAIHVASVKGYLHKHGGGWQWFVDPEQKIAYVRLTSFTQDTGKELEKAIEAIQQDGGKAIILDLRYNPGGLLTAAVETCDRFLSDGVIVSTHPDRVTGNAPTKAVAHKDDDDCTLPLIVLVNQYSASASEIVSGALKDHRRATILGERTFGKGSVQMLFPLSPDRSTLLKLTTSHYYLPLGKCIHREENSTDWGVDPDVTVEMTPEQMRAVIDTRQELDVLRDNDVPSGDKPAVDTVKPDTGPAATPSTTAPVGTKVKAKKRDMLSTDPQLSAAVLMLRLQLNGAQLTDARQ